MLLSRPEIVFPDKVINQHCSRVCYLHCIKKKHTRQVHRDLRAPNLWTRDDFWLDGRIHWSMSVWRRFLHPDTVWTHAAWSLRRSQLFLFSLLSRFFSFVFFFFFFTVQDRTLALQGGWCSLELHNSHVSHSSHVSPISHTPQQGWTDREKEGESEKGGRGRRGRNLICFVHEWLV